MTNPTPPFQKSVPTYLFVMFTAALTTNNFPPESPVGGDLRRQIGQPYVLWLLKVMCENAVKPTASCYLK